MRCSRCSIVAAAASSALAATAGPDAAAFPPQVPGGSTAATALGAPWTAAAEPGGASSAESGRPPLDVFDPAPGPAVDATKRHALATIQALAAVSADVPLPDVDVDELLRAAGLSGGFRAGT